MKIIKHQAPVLFCTLVLSFIAATAHAAEDKHARNLAASCAACHGTNGNSVGGAPVLAGLDKAYFVSQMKDLKSGTRPATVMNKHAKGYSDEEFELLGSYFAAQKRVAK